MKKFIIFIITTAAIIACLLGVINIVHSFGGYGTHSTSKVNDSGKTREMSKADFELLKPLEWDDETDSQYDEIIHTFGKPDRSRKTTDKVSQGKKISHLSLTWLGDKRDISLGFYKYSDKGQWILHDKTWTDK